MSEEDNLLTWLNEQYETMLHLVESDTFVSTDAITQTTEIITSAKKNVKWVLEGLKLEKDRDDDIMKYETIYNDILNMMEDVLVRMKSKSTQGTDAANAISLLMNDDTFKRIQELEKQILYRSFYFPGGNVQKLVRGVGDSESVEWIYDQIPSGEYNMFARWDPRYNDDYIAQAKQQGFHRNFLYYNNNTNDMEPINYAQANTILSQCINWTTGKISSEGSCDKMLVAGIIGGLVYFDKSKSFMDETGNPSALFNRVYLNNNDLIQPTITKLTNLIGQTEKNFTSNNYGYSAEDRKYTFDGAKYVAEWIELEDKYTAFKQKIWTLLQGIGALNMCTNNISGTFVGNITIDQEMSCVQTIMDSSSGDKLFSDDYKAITDESKTSKTDPGWEGDKTTTTTGGSTDNTTIEDVEVKQSYKFIGAIIIIVVLLLGLMLFVWSRSLKSKLNPKPKITGGVFIL